MRASLDIDTHLLSYLYFNLILFSSFSASSPSSSCESQAPFDLNGFYKAGDVVLGGFFPINFNFELPELHFTSKPRRPICHDEDRG